MSADEPGKPSPNLSWKTGALALGPVVVFCLTFRREVRVGFAFAEHELAAVLPVILAASAMLVATYFVVVRAWKADLRILYKELRDSIRTTRWAFLATAPVIGFYLVNTLLVRYHAFSEVHYSLEVRDAIAKGDFSTAYSLCGKYLYLYPQRRSTGGVPDPVCTPFMDLVSRARGMQLYINSQPLPDSLVVVDGEVIPYIHSARWRARWLLDTWALQESSSNH